MVYLKHTYLKSKKQQKPFFAATDVIAKNIQFPEINIGDWITFENFGAYRAVVSCGFNGFVNHPVVGFISKKDW